MVFGACAGVVASCATLSVPEKLARVGLELVSESEARVPPEDLGKHVPCRTLPSAAQPALPPHPAGYLFVRALDSPADAGARAILRALEAWQPGHSLFLRIRRNPYTMQDAEWWEADVKLTLR